MKCFLLTLILLGSMVLAHATDPIKQKSYFVQVDLSYSFYHFYNQALFEKNGLGFGGAVSLGHRAVPVYLEYTYQMPLEFKYRNNEIRDQFQEIGLRYNLNHLTYLLPHGLDPYLGAGVMFRNNEFTQYDISGGERPEVLNSFKTSNINYKLSAGLRLGSRNVIFGLHYDFLPKGLDVPNPEGEVLQIYNSMYIFSARVGIRFNHQPGNRIKCPRLNKRVKRTLSF